MSQVKKIGDTLPENNSTTTHKPNFANDVVDVNITLPVKSDSKKIIFDVQLNCWIDDSINLCNYDFDFLPNVDINQYLQFVVNLYNNGVTSYSSK